MIAGFIKGTSIAMPRRISSSYPRISRTGVSLPGDYQFSFTGMEVLHADKSQFR